nr:hypothetical protein [Moraxella sp. CTOTU48268]
MWNIHGVIPPIAIGEDGHSANRSPYLINIIDFIQRFSFTVERTEILSGLLAYRQYLYSLDIVNGLQWINGSFTENVEVLRGRPPADIDLVTLGDLSKINNLLWVNNNPSFFDRAYLKENYKVDAYTIDLSKPSSSNVNIITYWYSMWSHQRETDIWKGFFTIPLSPNEDIIAGDFLKGVSSHA